MASAASASVIEALLDTEAGTITLANLKSYYQSYLQEQTGNGPVSYADYVAVLESYYRISTIAGES